MSTAKQSQHLLQLYTAQLVAHPLRTKAITAGTLCFLQDILASHFAGLKTRSRSDNPIAHLFAALKIESRAFKMALYGFFVSAPLGHVLVGKVARTLPNRRLAQVLASNLIVAPIQTLVYLACMAVIGGAKTFEEVAQTIRAGFMTVIKVTWMSSPLATVFAQKFIAPELWAPFFNLVSFVLGTYFNTKVKKLRAAKEKKEREARGE